jgi:thiol:disulfide interchange protein DsbG
MRLVLLATTAVAFPLAAFAQSHCALPAAVAMAAEAPIPIPPPIAVGGPPVPLMPTAAPSATSSAAPPIPAAPAMSTSVMAPSANQGGAAGSADIRSIPALVHIAAAGASLSDLGTSHGLRTVYARNGGQVMVFEVAPDGQATVAGLMTDLSVDQLKAMGGEYVTELPPQHGLRALFLRNGPQFQVFYASPDNERVIPGVMWDAAGKDLTRDQVSSIPGTVPTVTIGATPVSAASAETGGASLLAVAQGTTHGSIGNTSAPELWMFIDPQCSFSERAMQALGPFIAAGKVRLNVIPLSILDGEDNGLSTRTALSLVSLPSDLLVAAWESGQASGPAASDAGTRLQGNMAAAAAIHLQGTPTFVWRKADGTEGRLDGVPPDVGSLIASIGG